jgi:hypothetical protein
LFVVEAGGERFEGELELEQSGMPSHRVPVTVDAHEMHIDGKRLETCDGFVGGSFERIDESGRCRVLLISKRTGHVYRAPWRFIVPDAATADAILRAAKVHAEQGPLRIRFGNQVGLESYAVSTFAIVAFVGVFIVSEQMPMAFVVATLAFAAIFMAAIFLASDVEIAVGTDGVVRRQLRRREFVPFSRIQSAVIAVPGLALNRIGEAPLWLIRLVVRPRTPQPIEAHLADLIAMRIREAKARHAAVRAKDPTAQEKERREMPIAEWIAELRARPEVVPTYRIAPDEKNFEQIFADGSIDVVSRACSAFALKVKEGDSAVPRLRVLASTTASPKLRVALEKIADGAPDSEIARSIEKLR